MLGRGEEPISLRLTSLPSLVDMLTIEGAIGRMGVVGVATIALLSGSGAVYTPYKFLHFFIDRVDARGLTKMEEMLTQSR